MAASVVAAFSRDAMREHEHVEAGPGGHHRGGHHDAEQRCAARASSPTSSIGKRIAANASAMRTLRSRRMPSPATRWVIAVEITSTLGHQRIERRRVEVAAASDRGADHDDPVLDGSTAERAVEDALRADGADGAAWAVIGDRQREVAVGRHDAVAEHEMIGGHRQRFVERACCDAQRE